MMNRWKRRDCRLSEQTWDVFYEELKNNNRGESRTKKSSWRPESFSNPTEDYFAHAASFTQKHTIVETASHFGVCCPASSSRVGV
jgi:hypothetical protein